MGTHLFSSGGYGRGGPIVFEHEFNRIMCGIRPCCDLMVKFVLYGTRELKDQRRRLGTEGNGTDDGEISSTDVRRKMMGVRPKYAPQVALPVVESESPLSSGSR